MSNKHKNEPTPLHNLPLQRDKLLANYFNQISTTRSNKSNHHSYLPQDFLPSSTRGGTFYKDPPSLKPPSTPQGTSSHKMFLFDQKPRTTRNRTSSMIPPKVSTSKYDNNSGSKRDSMPEISIHLSPNVTKEEISTPKSLNGGVTPSTKPTASKFYVSPNKPKMQSQSMLSNEFLKGLSLKKSMAEGKIYDMRDPEQIFQDTIKGVVFSDSKERYAVYQKRYLALKANSGQEPIDTSSTLPKKKKSPSKTSLKEIKSSREMQVLKDALAQHLSVQSPGKETPKMTMSYVSPHNMEHRERYIGLGSPKAIVTTKVLKKACGSASQSPTLRSQAELRPTKEDPVVFEQAPILIKNLEEKSVLTPSRASREELNKPEKVEAKEVAPKTDQEIYTELLEADKQTFDFEKMMVTKRNGGVPKNIKDVKESAMYISVASPTAKNEMFFHNENHITSRKANFYGKAGENLLRSAFAIQVKEDTRQILPSSESTKQGSTCQSSKLTKGSPLTRKGERREWEERDDSDLEKLIGMIESEGEKKGNK